MTTQANRKDLDDESSDGQKGVEVTELPENDCGEGTLQRSHEELPQQGELLRWNQFG
jgi:hypothetical protein